MITNGENKVPFYNDNINQHEKCLALEGILTLKWLTEFFGLTELFPEKHKFQYQVGEISFCVSSMWLDDLFWREEKGYHKGIIRA